jgi:FkbM family methyltransferase
MSLFRRLAECFSVYRILRYSRLYDWIARIKGSPYARWMADDRSFYSNLFSQNRVRKVFDVGANVGDKAHVFAKLADQVICIEADPDLADVLRYRFRNRRSVFIRQTAIGDFTGVAKLFRKQFSGFNTLSPKWSELTDKMGVVPGDAVDVPITTLDRLIAEHGLPDYIKIDIEGYELPAICGLSHSIAVLSFEANLPTFLAETTATINRLLTINPSLLFNFRRSEESKLYLSEMVAAAELLSALEKHPEGACEVFAIRPAHLG